MKSPPPPTTTKTKDESSSSSRNVVTQRLETLIERGEIHRDEHQFQAATELDKIYHYLMTHDPPVLEDNPPPQHSSSSKTKKSSSTSSSSSSSFWGSFFGSSNNSNERMTNRPTNQGVSSPSSIQKKSTQKGAYLFGGVGCGKTFLMNVLYDSIEVGPWVKEKQKVHFHKFMLQVHQHMHQQRKLTPDGDLITPVVNEILKEGRFLCLDEFQVTDVADALILQRLFDGLWNKGCILIATSNRPPSDLYLHGLQRDRFIPFTHQLEQQCTVIDLLDSETDYRLLAKTMIVTQHQRDDSGGKDIVGGTSSSFSSTTTISTTEQPVVYFLQGGSESSKSFRRLFYQLTENHPTSPLTLTTQGRNVPIPLACTKKQIAFFDFADLCQKAAGAADYLVIANHFSTVFCHNIPKLTIHELNWLRRFITFVDTMYELKVTLILHTAKPCESIREIFTIEGSKDEYQQDEVFAFDRTLSRLEEMSSMKYLKSQWLGGTKQRRAQLLKTAQMYDLSSTSSSPTNSNHSEHERVVTTVSIHPSLDNHSHDPVVGVVLPTLPPLKRAPAPTPTLTFPLQENDMKERAA